MFSEKLLIKMLEDKIEAIDNHVGFYISKPVDQLTVEAMVKIESYKLLKANFESLKKSVEDGDFQE